MIDERCGCGCTNGCGGNQGGFGGFGGGNRAGKKQGIIDKLMAFFEKYFGVI